MCRTLSKIEHYRKNLVMENVCIKPKQSVLFIVYSQYESIKLIQTKFIQTSESACHQIQWNFHNGAQMYSFSWKLKEKLTFKEKPMQIGENIERKSEKFILNQKYLFPCKIFDLHILRNRITSIVQIGLFYVMIIWKNHSYILQCPFVPQNHVTIF